MSDVCRYCGRPVVEVWVDKSGGPMMWRHEDDEVRCGVWGWYKKDTVAEAAGGVALILGER